MTVTKNYSRAKPGCSNYLWRNIPDTQLESMKEAAAKRGLTLRGWLLVVTDAASKGATNGKK